MATPDLDDNTTNDNDTTTEQGEDLRATLEAAFRKHATDDVDDAAPDAAPAKTAADLAGAPESKTDQDTGKTRDESGRFARKPQADGQPAQAITQGTPPAGQPAAPELKAPASWTPQSREKWSRLDPDIRAEIHRRESDMQAVLQKGANARQLADAFADVVRPYEMFIRQDGSNPLQAVQNLMQTAATMRIGTPQAKAQLVANIVNAHGVDIAMLDSLLAGTVAPQGGGQQQPQAFRDPRLDQFLAQQQQTQQQAEARSRAEVEQSVKAFASTHEFFNDVQQTIADLMEIRARQGVTLDLEAAYNEACQLNPEVRAVLATRARTSNNGAQSAAVLRAKRAASSVKDESTPRAGATVPKDDSVRSHIEAALEVHRNR